MLNKDDSIRLELLRFPLIVGVVFIHAYETTVDLSSGVVGATQNAQYVDFIRNFISQGLARVAVPLFFLMSGYLFFFEFVWTRRNFVRKIKSRFSTLFLPFLFWSFLTILIFALAQSIPGTQQYFSGKNGLISQFGGFEFLRALFGVGRSPLAYHLWFLRDLILLVLLSPLIELLFRVAATPVLAAMIFLWFFDVIPITTPSFEAATFFATGAFFARRNVSLFSWDRYGFIVILAYFLFLVLETIYYGEEWRPFLHRVCVVFGMVSVLCVTRIFLQSESISQRLALLSGASFFVYLAHEPLLIAARKIGFKIFRPESGLAVVAIYFLIPILVILFLLIVHRVAIQITPKKLANSIGLRP